MRYRKTVRMSHFLGLFQEGDGIGVDPRYALEAVNVDTAGGVLQNAARGRHYWAPLSMRVGTLMRLYRRWHAQADKKEVIIAATQGQLYYLLPGEGAWVRIIPPGNLTGFSGSDWSWVTYEVNREGDADPVDVLLMSNKKDGMVCFWGDTLTVTLVPTPKKFGVIARYAERIWGGGIESDPDMLVYSAPFDPFDWQQNNEAPEDGAGDVKQPSWDGDSFTAIKQFGSQLIAMKKHRVWRILGTDPGQYAFREQYGAGAMAVNTIVVDGERMLMLGTEGMLQYDGIAVRPFGQPFAKGIFERMNKAAIDKACACLYRGVYYCSLPLDGSSENNAVLLYNTQEQTWLLREGSTASAFLPTENALLYTNTGEPGRLWYWGEDAHKDGACAPSRWVGPWQDAGDMTALQGGWTVRMTVDTTMPMEMHVTIRTERRARTKVLKIRPGGKQKRLVFGGSGRRWRLELSCYDAVAWRIIGGIEVDVELDAQ